MLWQIFCEGQLVEKAPIIIQTSDEHENYRRIPDL